MPTIAAMSDAVTTDFSQLIAATMQKKPEQRPESLSAVLEQLEHIRIVKGRPAI